MRNRSIRRNSGRVSFTVTHTHTPPLEGIGDAFPWIWRYGNLFARMLTSLPSTYRLVHACLCDLSCARALSISFALSRRPVPSVPTEKLRPLCPYRMLTSRPNRASFGAVPPPGTDRNPRARQDGPQGTSGHARACSPPCGLRSFAPQTSGATRPESGLWRYCAGWR